MKTLVVAAVLAAALSPHAPAGATTPSKHYGRCEVNPFRPDDPTTAARETEVYAVVALYSTEPGANPVTATVTCQLRVDSVAAASVAATGAGAVLVHGRVAYADAGSDKIELCTVVDFADATPTRTVCARLTLRIPPEEPLRVLDEAIVEHVDPVVCPLFRAHAPGSGPVTIEEDGDVYVAGSAQWDCPPYDIWGALSR